MANDNINSDPFHADCVLAAMPSAGVKVIQGKNTVKNPSEISRRFAGNPIVNFLR